MTANEIFNEYQKLLDKGFNPSWILVHTTEDATQIDLAGERCDYSRVSGI